MKNKLNLPSHDRPDRGEGFTLVELLVVVAVVALLVLLQLPALARVTRQNKVAQCADNLGQFTAALHVYGNEFNDQLPILYFASWPWDLSWQGGLLLNQFGAPQQVMFCPGTAPRFTDADNRRLYANYFNFASHITGYANTFQPYESNLNPTNVNTTLVQQPISFGTSLFPPAKRVLLADATIGDRGNFMNIDGGFFSGGRLKNHLTAHLNGNIPAGGNLGMLDGHVEWRKFQDMQVRTTTGPSFWW